MMQNNLYNVQPSGTFNTTNQFMRVPNQTNQFYSAQNQQYFQQPSNQIQQIGAQSDINTNMAFIQGGEPTAKSIMLPNNSMYAYFDKELRQIFIKTVNQFGEPSVEPLWYFTADEMEEIRQKMGIGVQQQTPDNSNFVTQEQLAQIEESLNQKIQEILKNLNNFKSKVGNMNKKEKEKT